MSNFADLLSWRMRTLERIRELSNRILQLMDPPPAGSIPSERALEAFVEERGKLFEVLYHQDPTFQGRLTKWRTEGAREKDPKRVEGLLERLEQTIRETIASDRALRERLEARRAALSEKMICLEKTRLYLKKLGCLPKPGPRFFDRVV